VLIEPATPGEKPRKALAWAGIGAQIEGIAPPPGRLRLLSPFDPLVRDRKRLERLFGFDYRIEVFVPEARRRYGYYVFPLLEGDRLVGRIDVAAERRSGALEVKGLWLEPGIRMTAARQRALEAELERQRQFAGTGRVRFVDGYLATAG